MSNLIRYFPCPACASPLKMNSSHMLTATLREQFSNCGNHHCGAAYLIRSEITNVTSPAADLFSDNIKNLRIFDDKDKRALHLAIEFLERKWIAEDKIQNECVTYLIEKLQFATERAIVITQIALAEMQESTVTLNKSQSIGDNSIVINDNDGKVAVITLQELAEFAQKKQLI